MTERPNPLREAASKVGVAWSAGAAIVAYLVTSGVLSAAQGDAIAAAGEAAPGLITQVGGVVAGVIALGGAILASFRTVDSGREHVTPNRDPRDHDGTKLVRERGV